MSHTVDDTWVDWKLGYGNKRPNFIGIHGFVLFSLCATLMWWAV